MTPILPRPLILAQTFPLASDKSIGRLTMIYVPIIAVIATLLLLTILGIGKKQPPNL